MSQVDDAEHYYSRRFLRALAMAQAATDPAVRNIHVEMARNTSSVPEIAIALRETIGRRTKT